LRGASREDASLLIELLKNRETALEYYRIVIEVRNPDTVPALIEALQRYGGEEMPEVCLNCGNEELESAARTWAKDHGMWVATIGGSGGGSGAS
jgi:hypothetical protein